MKKTLSLLLALVMLIGMMPMQVFAADSEQPAPGGEVISIMGDSISTFAGYLPEGNATYYPKNTVQSVADTWWMQLITELDANLGVNESWSGSCVSVTSGERLPMASLERIQNLDNNGTPNVILFFGGTNDIAFFRETTPVGSFDPTTAPVQADLTKTEWDTYADGYVAAILRMRYYYPEARIVSILPTVNTKYYNNATLEQYNSVMRAICKHYGVEYVDLVAEGYTTKLLGDATHPNAAGMDFITDAVMRVLTESHSHSYATAITAPTCTEQGYTTYTCICGESYVDSYVDATGKHNYENGTCTLCGATELENPGDCSDGHQFGDWTECTSFTCQKRYMRQCVACGEKQYAKDISAQTIPFAVPAITANVGDLVNLSLYSVAFDTASVIPAAELTWTGEAVENGCVIPTAAGVYTLTASAGETSKTVYLVVKNPEDTEYVLYYDDFDNAALDGYRAIEVPTGTEYYVSDGKLILDATGNSNNHMRILLPEWIGDFGNYEITTSFSMQKAMANTYWFAVMARIQNNDFPYWQAAIRQNATASNGVEISTRTKASGATGGWTVTHKTALGEKLSASKYYTQTFGLFGTNGFHAVNGKTLLESNAITNTVGDVGFHLRASKVAVDSIKIVIASNDTAHSFGEWTVIREAGCTEAGEESRTCSRCGATETREIAAGHSLTKYEQKLPACTEAGWKAYEACSRCDYTTYVEVAATGHTFERDIHSVAHRGYSVAAPENTLIAYRMAKEKGFRYVECDVSLTADKKAVLLHDDTINRTSTGSGKITSLTYEQLLQYDFGSWMGEEFTGTKIPTFEEFLELCVELGLHPYIELKTSGYTKAEITALVRLVESFGLQDDCTWISFNATYLGYIKAADPTARLGYLRNDDATASVISTAKGLRTATNEVFLDLSYAKLTEANLLRAKENGFAVEVWTVDDENVLKSLPASIGGFTSNMLVAETILTHTQVTLPTCTEQGYTTYTCICGESYVDDYVDPTGEHIYENGVCSTCGTTQSQPIVITKQPVPAVAAIGEKATVFVEAIGEGLTYQWYYRDAGKTEFIKSSVTKSNYTLTVKTTNADRELYCVVTDLYGNQVTTETVRLLVPLTENLEITKQPVPDDAAIGEKATVFVEATGEGLTYQWYYRDTGETEFTKSSVTKNNYTLTVKTTNADRELYCVVTDLYGNQVTTETVRLLVPLTESLAITKQPVPDDALIGEKATVFVEATGEGLTYQWYYRDAGETEFTRSTVTKSNYTLTVKELNLERVLYCVITDAYGNQVTTDTVRLLIPGNERLSIVTQPIPAHASIGEKATVSVVATGIGLNYQWYYRDAGQNEFTKSTVTKSVYTLTVKESNINRELYCVISDADGNQITTDLIRLLAPVEEPLAIITQPAPTHAALGEKATVFVEATGDGLTYQWYYRDAGDVAFTKSTVTSNVYTLTVKTNNLCRELYCIITDGRGNELVTETVNLLLPLEEELIIVTQPVPDDVTVGEKATIFVEARGIGLSYQWYYRDSPDGVLIKSSVTKNTYTLTVKETNINRELYCVITDAHGNQIATNTVPLILPGKVYYASIHDALNENGGKSEATDAAVEVSNESGERVVTLLQNAQLTETIEITSNTTLDLNGYKIDSVATTAILIESAEVIIRNGDISLTASGTGTAAAPSVAVKVTSGSVLSVYDATITAVDAYNGTVVGILSEKKAELTLSKTSITVCAEKSLYNTCVYAYGTATLIDCTIIAESDYTGNAAGTAYASSSYGISSEGDLTLQNCYVWGAHSGVRATGNVFINGGTYEGYGHGGVYLAGPGTTSYLYNAAFNWAPMRSGTYADTIAGTNNAAFYIGANSNIKAYFDGCRFKSNNATKSYGIILRSSGGEKNNSVYISNSSFSNYKKYAYRIGNSSAATGLYIYSGVGNTYSGRVFNYSDKGFYTEESYAQIVAVKEASVKPSQTVNIGETVNYSLTVTNNGKNEQTVTVTDVIPENATYVSGGDSVDGRNIYWNEIIIPAGSQIRLSYTVQVNEDPSLYSDGMLSKESATVNGTEVSSYPIYIRRTLTAADAQYLKQAMLALHDSSYTSHTLLNWIYQVAYSKSPLITEDPVSTLNALYAQLDDANKALRNTVAPTLYGGTTVAGDVDVYFAGTRAVKVAAQDFMTGDVLLCENNGIGRIYLYFDGFVELTNGMQQIATDTVLTLVDTAERYAVIRPSVAFSSVSISKGMTDPSSLSAAQKALLVTAQNYVLRGERLQYDDSRLSSVSGAEFRWKKGAVAPENYTCDEWGYTNCAAFCYDLYYYGIGMNIGSYTTSGLIGKTAWRAYYYQVPETVSSTEAAAEQEKFTSSLQFGDLIIVRRDKDGNGTDDSGHIMFYIGDGRVIHSTGSSYDYATSVETYEPCMRYMDVMDYLFTPGSANNVFDSTVSKLAIIRPLGSFKAQLPAESQYRANSLGGLRVEKLASCKPSVSVNPGDEITFSFEILNANASTKIVTITDILPENTDLVTVAGGTCANGNLSFSVTVGAYQTASVSYTVKVKEGSYDHTAKVSCNSAQVNGVSLSCHEISIRNTLTADDQSRIKEAIAYYLSNNSEELTGIPLINAIYRRAGLEVPFSDEENFAGVANGILEKYTSKAVRINENGLYRQMLVDGLYGGRYLYTAELAFLNGGDRVRLPREHNLVPGDVIFAKMSTSERIYIYDGEYIYDITTIAIKQEDPAYRLERLMAFQHYFLILRPSFSMGD